MNIIAISATPGVQFPSLVPDILFKAQKTTHVFKIDSHEVLKIILEQFLNSRIANNENEAQSLMTEEGILQKEEGKFEFSGDYKSFRIKNGQKLGEGEFRFQVELINSKGFTSQLESISLKKILDSYYIDSVQIAG